MFAIHLPPEEVGVFLLIYDKKATIKPLFKDLYVFL